MIMTIILIIIAIIIHSIVYYTYRHQWKYREGNLFAILLPEGALLDPEIQHIQQQYKKKMKVNNLWMLASYIPLIALYPWMLFQVLYSLWLLISIPLWLTSPFRRSFQKTLEIKREHEWYIRPKEEANDQLFSDDGDEYWRNGITYHNANDRRVLVPKRIGTGKSINTATSTGKFIKNSTIIIIVIIFSLISIIMIRFQLNSPTFEIIEGDTIAIIYPMYSNNFLIDEMVDVSIVNDYPEMTKNSGVETLFSLRGHFLSNDLGEIRMYVFKRKPPYIKLQFVSGYVYYNDLDPEKTKQWYEKLLFLHNERLIEADFTRNIK